MFYRTNLPSSNLVEIVRNADPIEDCAKLLRQECKAYDFGIDNSYCDANDLNLSFESFKSNRPSMWAKFFLKMLDARELSERIVPVSCVIL